MSSTRSREKEDNNSKTVTIRSSYFQTEFTSPRKSDISSADEELVAISDNLEKLSLERIPDSRLNTSHGSPIKKVSISVQTGRSIIGQEDSLPKERKRWVRPPGVGQASTSSDPNSVVSVCQLKESSSEDDIKPQITTKLSSSAEIYQNRKDYITEKPMEGSSDQSLPQLSDQGEPARVVSPSSVSSVTPRPLEWDSGADVGYFQNYGTVARNDLEFSSTMERIALVQGRSGMLTRSDPEGTSSIKKANTAISAIGLPTAESTLINFNAGQGSSTKDQSSIIKKNNSKQKYHPLFPEVIIQHKGNISDSSNECHSSSRDMFDDPVKDSKLKKFSSSLENVNEIKPASGQAATFPRSQSQSNLNSELDYNSHLQRLLNLPQSVSSSSVATVISGLPRKSSSKSIQTSYLRNHIGTQSSLNGSLVPKTKKKKQNDSSTIDSTHLSSGDRVNSFEYLPGDVYENVSKPELSGFWENAQGVSLKNDVERGVQIIEEFIHGSNANNTLMKKELLHRVVEKLIETDYPEDTELLKAVAQQSSRQNGNREEVTGESSSEANQILKNKASSNSTTMCSQSSSTLQTTTESSRDSVKSVPVLASKSQGSVNSQKMERRVHKDRSTDLSSESRSDWKASFTRAEKLYELKRKGLKRGEDQLLDFVNSERENQLDWIVKEINHLSNLKTLLEKHERLRKNLNRLKTAKSKSDLSPSKYNLKQGGFRRRQQYSSSHKLTENISKRKSNLSSLREERGWDSHNYEIDTGGKPKRSISTETRKEDLSEGAKSVAYTITFEPDIKPQKISRPDIRPLIADRQTLEKESRTRVREAFRHPSLQDCLINKRPDIVSRAEVRRQTVAELAAIRQVREEQRPAVLAAALNCETVVVPPVSLVKRVVSQKEMREQTERKYRKTFEVKKKISDQKLKEIRKTNRLMADIFNKRLQLLTLKGHTNLSNSIDVISAV